jgi:ABC-2 type transport system ATP-binding protein
VAFAAFGAANSRKSNRQLTAPLEVKPFTRAPIPGDVILRVEGVAKSYPTTSGLAAFVRRGNVSKRNYALTDVSFEVRSGELFGLLGANGSGKTTLLKLLATLLLPDRGTIVLDGVDIVRRPHAAKAKIGLCTSEDRSFYQRLSARANLEFFGVLAGLQGDALGARIAEVANLVDLRDSLDKRFAQYSSGMRQRLVLARALLADPEVLFLDEPTRAVDPVHADAMRTLIRDVLVRERSKTVILATNLLDEAWEICDRVAIVNRGRVVACAPPRALDARLCSTQRYFAELDDIDDDFVARVRRVPSMVRVDVQRSALGVDVEIELQASSRGLTDVLRALSSDGFVLRRFGEILPEPMDTFIHAVSERDEK